MQATGQRNDLCWMMPNVLMMKKLSFLLPVLALACSKTETVNPAPSPSISISDSSAAPKGSAVELPADTAGVNQAFRVVESNKIIRTINGDMLPVTLSDEFATPGQQYIIKIKNFKSKQVSALIHPADSTMNIRFNQIRYADGTYDGPFGRSLSLPVSEHGELWLLVGRSNMASGNDTGKFSINLK